VFRCAFVDVFDSIPVFGCMFNFVNKQEGSYDTRQIAMYRCGFTYKRGRHSLLGLVHIVSVFLRHVATGWRNRYMKDTTAGADRSRLSTIKATARFGSASSSRDADVMAATWRKTGSYGFHR